MTVDISSKFKKFCFDIRIKDDVVKKISYRYGRITKQLNTCFRNIKSNPSNSLYVGSYGRDTDIHVSDIEILFILPYLVYERISHYQGNGQSALL
jgi:hypothetical protein